MKNRKRTRLLLITFLGLAIGFGSCNSADFEQMANIESVAEAADSYSAEEGISEEDQRKVIKTASITLNVDHLERSVIDLKAFLKPIKGYVYNYEINNESYQADSYQKNLDSNVVVEKIQPNGNLSVRIPIAYADSFINYILHNEARIASLKITDEDVTENLWEKKQVANVYAHSGKAKNHKGSSKNIGYDNNTSISAIKAKALAAKMDYRTKYLWFDINMTAKPFFKSTTSVAAKNYRTPIHIGLADALVKGWHICADIILALVTIWPVFLLSLLGLIVYKRFRVKAT